MRGASAPGRRTEVTPPFAEARVVLTLSVGRFSSLWSALPRMPAGRGREPPSSDLPWKRAASSFSLPRGSLRSAALGSSGQTSLERAVLGQPLKERDSPYNFLRNASMIVSVGWTLVWGGWGVSSFGSSSPPKFPPECRTFLLSTPYARVKTVPVN
ncbi:unnamed protein product [Rangifer tarandus platyrhynchus]|uniref:Uncharacterized protein n=2 Tax=Rangifer tarandus platyrhynchus TaxID=3082113 RepID=A0ABN8YT01_RANTA|nr:unnamed protein product [Rangifer tarandus platyrhynchus]